jgi:hypothetical protein
MSTAELATSYAALILADDGVEITVSSSRKLLYCPAPTRQPAQIYQHLRGNGLTEPFPRQADKLSSLIKAANVEVEPIWASLFAKVRHIERTRELRLLQWWRTSIVCVGRVLTGIAN